MQDSIIAAKDRAFKRLLYAQKLNHEVNVANDKIIAAQSIKLVACDEYGAKLESANSKLTFRQGFMQIGTPIIAVGASALGFIVGYYVAKALP